MIDKAVILRTKENVKWQLLAIPGVNGVGVGPENINVYVVKKTPELTVQLPKAMNNIPVRIIEVGEIVALPELSPTSLEVSRIRPAPGGVSIGNISITAGTLGMVVIDNLTKKRVILSNAHVLCSDPFLTGQLTLEIVQPGTVDGGVLPDDYIANLTRWVPLYNIGTNKLNIVDCAIAEPLVDEDISDEILEVGEVRGITGSYINQEVMKSGRNGLDYGTVTDVNADIQIVYLSDDALFTNQIITSPILTGGDSGSIVMDNNKKVVGLGFAGSSDISIVNKIGNVLNRLNISIPGVFPEKKTILPEMVFSSYGAMISAPLL